MFLRSTTRYGFELWRQPAGPPSISSIRGVRRSSSGATFLNRASIEHIFEPVWLLHAHEGAGTSAAVPIDGSRYVSLTRVTAACLGQPAALTGRPTDAPLFRLLVEPSEANGLRVPSRLVVDTLTTVPKNRLGSRMGQLGDEDLIRLHRAIMVLLGLARSSRSSDTSSE
jgi:mRNA-degrading endonuclease toxin of MazEF toxin-antitoxin module